MIDTTSLRTATFALGIGVLLGFAAVAVYLLPLNPSIVSAQLTFSQEAFASVHGQWSPLARERFRSHFAWDYGLIAGYALWGHLHGRLAPSIHRLSRHPRRLVVWLLPLAACADVMENLLHGRLVDPDQGVAADELYALAGGAASLKWALGLAFVGLAALALRRHKNAG